MSIDVNNESGTEVDEQAILDIARYALARDGAPPALRTVGDRRGRRRHGAAPHPVDGPAGPDPCHVLPDGRAAPAGQGRRGAPEGLLGDIVLCPEVAARQGAEAETRHTMDEELQLLTVHGVLHLLGYDHEEPAAQHDRHVQRQQPTHRRRPRRAAVAWPARPPPRADRDAAPARRSVAQAGRQALLRVRDTGGDGQPVARFRAQVARRWPARPRPSPATPTRRPHRAPARRAQQALPGREPPACGGRRTGR
ncbi:Endoribonuclease YbeY [Streptomyces fumanus]